MPDVGIIQNVGVVLSVNHNYGPERATYMVKLIDDPTPFKFAAHPDHFEWIE